MITPPPARRAPIVANAPTTTTVSDFSAGSLPVHDGHQLHFVALVNWPSDETERATLAAARRPRILLVDPDAAPPLTTSAEEDWVRLPAGRAELEVRARSLLASTTKPTAPANLPVLDTDGVLRHGGQLVTIPPVEARILAVLIGRRGQIVPRDELVTAGWAEGGSDALLDSRIKLLRRRIAKLGLTIHTVRGTGMLLEAAS